MTTEGTVPPATAPPQVPPEEEVETGQHEVHLPPLSIWPVSTAAGITITAAGLVTLPAVSVVGGIVAIYSIVEWVRELLNEHEHSGTH